MSNPVLNLLGATNPTTGTTLNQLAGMIKAASDPMAMVQQMAMTDPRMQQVSETIRQNGGVQQAVYNLAKQKGLDPNAVLQQAKQFAQQIK